MAGLGSPGIRARTQFGAVAWLRWRLFANGFRRKGAAGEMVARIIVFPFAALFVVGPVVGASTTAYFAARDNHLEYLTGIFWGVFVLQILVSINISAPGVSFDPESLIRYPLNFSRYLTIRLFLGLLSVSTILGTLALLGAATGIGIADPALAASAFSAAIALALCNMLFVRMVFAWVDRWLSTRRARELFTGLIFAFSIGIQYVNVTVNGLGRHTSHAERQAKIDAMMRAYRAIEPAVHALPPGLAGNAIAAAHRGAAGSAILLITGILIIATIFLAVFAWRMHTEYRGESLSEAARPVVIAGEKLHAPSSDRSQHALIAEQHSSPFLSPVIAALLHKEWLYIRRNPAQFYGLIAPLAMVFIFAGRMSRFGRTGYLFPAAVVYAVLGIAAMAYNALGLDANGVQFYFIAPVPMRSVMLAKNLFGFAITALQLVLVYALITFTSAAPSGFIAVCTVLWVVIASFVNATVGNVRSITAPRKVDPGRISRKQTSQLSALMCIGIMLAVGGAGAGVLALSRFAGMPWLAMPILATLAGISLAVYLAVLRRVDSIARDHREALVEELSKTS